MEVVDYDLVHDMGFVIASSLVLTDPSLSHGALRLYLILRDFAGQDVSAFPGRERLGDLMGVAEKSITRLMGELEERGLVKIERRGLSKTNRYHLVSLTKLYGLEAALNYCERKGRKVPPWLAEELTGRKSNEVPDVPKMSSQEGSEVSFQEGPKVSHKADGDEADGVEADGALSRPADADAVKPRRRRRTKNPLAVELQEPDEERSRQIAQKAAKLAGDDAGETFVDAARAAARSDESSGFGRGFDGGRAAFEDALQGEGRDDELDPPHETTKFEPWSDYCASRIRHPKRKGRGVKAAEDWNGNDFEVYLAGMVAGWWGIDDLPPATAKTRAQAKRLVGGVGGEQAKEVLDFCLKNWDDLRTRLRIDSAWPSAAIIEGYLASLLTFMKEGLTKASTGTDRVQASYEDEPDEGWG